MTPEIMRRSLGPGYLCRNVAEIAQLFDEILKHTDLQSSGKSPKGSFGLVSNLLNLKSWWPLEDSNLQPKDYESNFGGVNLCTSSCIQFHL